MERPLLSVKLRSDSIKRLDRVRRRCFYGYATRHLKALNTWIHGRDLYRFLEGHSIKATSALREFSKDGCTAVRGALEAWFRTVFFMRGMERVVARIVHRLVAKSVGHVDRHVRRRTYIGEPCIYEGPWIARGASSCGSKGERVARLPEVRSGVGVARDERRDPPLDASSTTCFL